MQDLEKGYLRQALRQLNGQKAKVAAVLGIAPKLLADKLRAHGLS
jgi:DNA-binding NtrC family response regulator